MTKTNLKARQQKTENEYDRPIVQIATKQASNLKIELQDTNKQAGTSGIATGGQDGDM